MLRQLLEKTNPESGKKMIWSRVPRKRSNIENVVKESIRTWAQFKGDPRDIRTIKEGAQIRDRLKSMQHPGGTTLVCAYLTEHDIVTANLGDSRCVIARTVGEDLVATALTTDHKPDNSREKAMIEEA